jgi:hypothetical protein
MKTMVKPQPLRRSVRKVSDRFKDSFFPELRSRNIEVKNILFKEDGAISQPARIALS